MARGLHVAGATSGGRLEPLAIRAADGVLQHRGHAQRHTGGAAAEIFPGCEHKISSLTHGTDLPQLPTERERSLARSALGVSPDQPVLLFFGMIKPYKGLEDLLDAMPAVLARAPNVRLCIAGEPLMNMRAVMERIAALQPGTVILRLGFVPQAEIGRYFASADLVVAPYRKIAASSVVLQALAFGRPVLATRVGALPALLDEGYCGYLAGDNLAEAIVTALADREHWPSWAAADGNAWRSCTPGRTWRERPCNCIALRTEASADPRQLLQTPGQALRRRDRAKNDRFQTGSRRPRRPLLGRRQSSTAAAVSGARASHSNLRMRGSGGGLHLPGKRRHESTGTELTNDKTPPE